MKQVAKCGILRAAYDSLSESMFRQADSELYTMKRRRVLLAESNKMPGSRAVA